jgi:hypothetical protein
MQHRQATSAQIARCVLLRRRIQCFDQLRSRTVVALAAQGLSSTTEPVHLADAPAKACLKMYNFEDLEQWCEQVGERRARAKHIWKWLYGDGNWIEAFSDAQGRQDGFGKAFMTTIPELSTCDGGIHLEKVVTSSDGTQKLIFAVDGGGSIETVLIPIVREQVRS